MKIRLRSQAEYDVLLQQEDYVAYRVQESLQNAPWWNGRGTVEVQWNYRDVAGSPEFFLTVEPKTGNHSITEVRSHLGRNQIIGQDAMNDLLAVRKDLMTLHAPTWRRAVAMEGKIITPGQGNSRAGCVVEVAFFAILDEDCPPKWHGRIGPSLERGQMLRLPKKLRRWTLSYEDGGELGFTIGYGETAEAASGDARMRWFDELAQQLPMA